MHTGLIVAKFGGTSMAQMERVAAICLSDPMRSVIVVSSPKITDILIRAWDLYATGAAESEIALQCSDADHRFERACGTAFVPGFRQQLLKAAALVIPSRALFVSRGEYFAAQALAERIGGIFIDAADVICFGDSGVDIDATYERCRMLEHRIAEGQRIVIPGFYGAVPSGHIRLLDRGGSDITGALVAAALGADVYENWTDVQGIRFTDPRDYPPAHRIEVLTYAEMRELAYAGARVLHEHAIFPVRRAGIPTHLRNTFAPELAGTMIVAERGDHPTPVPLVVGIAGRTGFSTIKIEAAFMHERVGYAHAVLGIIRDAKLRVDHMPTGIDSMSLVVLADSGVVESAAEAIRSVLSPDRVTCEYGTSLISVVGAGMRSHPGMLARVATALADAGVNIRLVTQSTSEISIIVGVGDTDYHTAITALSAGLS